MAQQESSSRPAARTRHRREGEASKRNQHRKRKTHTRPAASTDESSQGLSAGALAQLNRENAKQKPRPERRKRTPRQEAPEPDTRPPKTRKHQHADARKNNKKGKKRRVVSGAMMEEGRVGRRAVGGWSDGSFEKEGLYQRPRKKSRRKLWILLGCSIAVLIIVIAVAVVVSKKKSADSSADSSLAGKDRAQIPAQWQNTYLDPWSWQTTKDFNVTFTDEMVGGLPVMGLYGDWDDSARANDKVPALKDKWGPYGDRPARGVNLGGWLSLEPFITPSLFAYKGVIDEYSLCRHLGPAAAKTIEAHYASFVTEDTFRAIAAAGLDHVRIPFSYWAVEVYDGDPYVFRTSWRYLLRGIEWARKHGLRVNLDLHALPGSQNGWNHSGRFGPIGWLNGTDGQANARRSLELHDRLSRFFAQARYRNIVTHYGLVNEPRMTFLRVADVVTWTEQAYKRVRANGVGALVVFGDGFMGLDKWQGLLPARDDMVLDVHQYVIFNQDQIAFTHRKKVQYACDGWTQQAELSMDPARGHGPTVFAEWSQADTDCAEHLTGVGWGSRWEGTFDTGDAATSTRTPRCPAKDASCSCAKANQDPGQFAAGYKKFLRMFAEAQMHSFEKGWGWWYWTWKTESAPLWSYEAGLAAGILPSRAYEPDFRCDADVPDFAKDGLSETY